MHKETDREEESSQGHPKGHFLSSGSSRFSVLHSVRFRVTTIAVVVVAVTLALGAFVLVSLLEHSLVENIERAASDEAANIAALAKNHALAHQLPVLHGDAVAQVVSPSGKVVAFTPGASPTTPMATFLPPPEGEVAKSFPGLPVRDDEAYLVVARSLQLGDAHYVIYAARSLASVEATLHTLDLALVIGLSGLLALMAIGTWTLTGRTLQPVESIREEVEQITAGRLERRVPVPESKDEVASLAVTMNDMLARLEQAVVTQKRFVSDASHELRSPLTGLIAEVEVTRAHPDWANFDEVLSSVLDEARRMEAIVGNLLFLARGDEKGLALDKRPVELATLVREELERRAGRAGPRIQFLGTWVGPEKEQPEKDAKLSDASPVVLGANPVVLGASPVVLGNAEELSRMLRNLLDNAQRFARSCVEVTLEQRGNSLVLSVRDDGPGIPPDLREKVFERFRRLDEDRSRQTGGTGLGLAIVRQIVDAHRGKVWIEDAQPGARFVVRLPALGQ